MNSRRHILTQILDLVDRMTLSRLVDRYDAESRVRHFGCRQQLICMVFAQLTGREGLRDIATCLMSKVMATPQAEANVERGVDVQVTGKHR